MRGTLIVSVTPDSLYDIAAERIAEVLLAAAPDQGAVRWAVAGGHTPRPVYERLAAEPYRSRIPWQKVHMFWGDERMVSHDNPDSNFRMVSETLLTRVPLPEENIHPVPERSNATDAAAAYEEDIRKHFKTRRGFPEFDLVLLGVGTDGHVASLFPHTVGVEELQKLAVIARGHGGMSRVSLSLPVINNARHVFMIAIGKEKSEIVRRGAEQTGPLPVQRVRPKSDKLVWLLDQAAASELTQVKALA